MRDGVVGPLAAAYLVACLLLGGASAAGALANAALQLAAVVILVLSIWTWRHPLVPDAAKPLAWLALAFVLITLLSLVPLPSGLWQSLPGREPTARGYELLDIQQPSIPFSLAPQRTIWSMLSLLPPVAMFVLVARLSSRWRRRLAATLIAGAVLSIVLSGFQLLGGPGSPLRFYQITNPNRAVGFFSNASHLTTLILCALPITAVLAARAVKSRSSQKQGAGLTLGGSLAAFLAAGVVISNSTAGYGLFMPAALMSFLVFRRAAIGPLSKTWAVALIAFSIAFVAIALSGSLAQQTIADKFSEHPTSRGTIWATTMTAAKAFAPVGSGLGTFAGVYRTFDPVDRASNLFVNHAHNDYLEMALELGVAGLLLVLGFLIWAIRRTMRAWLEDFDGATLARAGSAIIALILLHSVVEYPLRTSALAAVFALACAFLVPPPARLRKQGEHGGTEIGGGKLKHVEAD